MLWNYIFLCMTIGIFIINKLLLLWHHKSSHIVFVCIFRSNLLGTHFTIYDSGEGPKSRTLRSDESNLRREVAAVAYVSLELAFHKGYIGLVQDCSNSIANALELMQSCTKPSIWVHHWNLVEDLCQKPFCAQWCWKWPFCQQWWFHGPSFMKKTTLIHTFWIIQL